MTISARCLAIAALLTLAACGNKGPLVRPSSIPAPQGVPATQSPPSSDPTNVTPVEDKVPATLDPSTPAPPASPPPGDGHG